VGVGRVRGKLREGNGSIKYRQVRPPDVRQDADCVLEKQEDILHEFRSPGKKHGEYLVLGRKGGK
jgi:hypothetical protein